MAERGTPHSASAEENENTPLRSNNPTHPQAQSSRRSLSVSAQYPPAREATFSLWGTYYKVVSVLCLLILATTSAIGHHQFYSTKNGTLAEHQQWTIRIGTGLAYLLGFSLAAVVGISRDQWLWRTLRTRFLSLRSIDAMFGVTTNPFLFFDGGMVLGAKISTVMAATKWLFPLSTIFTPSTISVLPKPVTTTFDCTVPSLYFNYTEGAPAIKPKGNYLNIMNSTANYHGPSTQAKKIFSLPAFLGRAVPGNSMGAFGSAGRENCAINCTYTVQFLGPAVNCTEIDPLGLPELPRVQDVPYDFSQCESPSSEDTLNIIPIFIAQRWEGSYTTFWIMGTLAGEPDDRIACRKPYAYTCQASVANYTIQQVISGNQSAEPIVSADILYPIKNDPKTTQYNAAIRANWALFDTLVGMMEGLLAKTYWTNDTESIIDEPGTGTTYYTSTGIEGTSLFNFSSKLVHPLGPAIEKMVFKMTASLLSDPYLVYSIDTETKCSSTKMQNQYHYKPFILVVTYSVAIGVSGLFASLGLLALYLNGVASDVSFSTILRTTRNPTLDREFAGGCLGEVPLPRSLGEVRLKFGELLPAYTDDDGEKMKEDEVRHAGMGVEGEVSPLRRRGRYS